MQLSNIPNQLGPTGPSGHPGVSGIPIEYKPKTFLCRKDYGFFKAGQIIILLFYKNTREYEINGTRHIKESFMLSSKDGKMELNIGVDEAKEYFIFDEDLRDKLIDDIIK